MSSGGSQQQILGILKRLDRARFLPELFTLAPQGELLSSVPSDVPIHISDIRSPPTRWTKIFSPLAYRRRVTDLERLLQERRIDAVYDRTYHMTLITSAATRRNQIPRASVIVTDPQLDFETNPERFRWIKRRLLRAAYLRANAVFSVSEGVREDATKYYRLPADKVETFENCFDVDDLRNRSLETLPQHLAPTDRSRAVAAGRLHEQKGFDLLIEATRQIVFSRSQPNIEVLIVGSGQLYDQLTSLIQQTGLANHVRLVGYLPNPLPLFRSADLFCLPSRYEGMPNVLVEALCSDVPVLAADCPSGPREILEGKWGTLVPSGDADALAGGIVEIMQNTDTVQGQVLQARSRIRERFDFGPGIQRLQERLLRLAHA